MVRKPTKRQSTELRKKQIIEAIRKLMIEYGSENVTIRKIAKAIGVSEGAIYRHFKNKREMLSFLIEYIDESLMGDIEKGSPGGTAMKGLKKILGSHFSYVQQRKGISFLVIAEIISLGDKRLNHKIFETLRKYIDRIELVLEDGIRNGEIRSDLNIKTAANIFFGMIQGMVTMWALGGHDFNLKGRYLSTWNIFCEAIRKH